MCVLGLAGSRKPKSKKVNVRRMLTLHAPWLHREWTGRTTDLDRMESKVRAHRHPEVKVDALQNHQKPRLSRRGVGAVLPEGARSFGAPRVL